MNAILFLYLECIVLQIKPENFHRKAADKGKARCAFAHILRVNKISWEQKKIFFYTYIYFFPVANRRYSKARNYRPRDAFLCKGPRVELFQANEWVFESDSSTQNVHFNFSNKIQLYIKNYIRIC